MSLVNLDFLEREAQTYRTAKEQFQQSAKNIDKTIIENTKEESENVQKAIDDLNKKIESIMSEDIVKEEHNKMKESKKQMNTSINVGVSTFFKVRDIIRKKGLSKEVQQQMEDKLYKKIVSKFLTKEEIIMFERMVSQGPIMIVPGGTIGRNNMILN